jgi:prepilin-type N-terminal cleavage/methylation domain-containing protein
MNSRNGFSLLEVILALALLVGAIAVSGELIRLGTLSAARARDLTHAQLICESKLAEITAGIVLPEAVSYAQYEYDPEWVYSVELAAVDVPGLVLLRVTVGQNLLPTQRPVEFSLTRLIQDPGVELPEAQSIDTGSDSGTTTSSSTGGTP